MGELLNEGLLYKRRGIGMFVEPGAQKKLLEKKRKTYLNEDLRTTLTRGRSFQVKKQEVLTVLNEIYDEGV